MASGFWEQVVAAGHEVPSDRPLDELTAELTIMLGDPDPHLREHLAFATLTAWLRRGVYDDLLAGLGDGMTAGLAVGLGDSGTDTVFRRSWSVLVLAACIDRDVEHQLLPHSHVLDWGDRVAAWFVRERDLRGQVTGKGAAGAVAHGADAIGALARSPAFGKSELTVLLDVLADRLLLPTDTLLTDGEPDRLAAATMDVLRRDLVPLSILEPWVRRLAQGAGPVAPGGLAGAGDRPAHNVQVFLRSLYLQLTLGPMHPAVRPDLLLVLVDALRSTNPRDLGSR